MLVEDEDVRVLWYEEASGQTGNPNVLKRKICFDIYVRREHLNDVTNDIFQSRARMVSQKIQELLSGREQVGRICFAYSDDYALGTKMVGYVRHHLVMTYMASHR